MSSGDVIPTQPTASPHPHVVPIQRPRTPHRPSPPHVPHLLSCCFHLSSLSPLPRLPIVAISPPTAVASLPHRSSPHHHCQSPCPHKTAPGSASPPYPASWSRLRPSSTSPRAYGVQGVPAVPSHLCAIVSDRPSMATCGVAGASRNLGQTSTARGH
jgi:hypothetical protein